MAKANKGAQSNEGYTHTGNSLLNEKSVYDNKSCENSLLCYLHQCFHKFKPRFNALFSMSYLSVLLILLLIMGTVGFAIIRNSIPNKINFKDVSASSNAAGTINTVAGNGSTGGLVTGSSPNSVGLSNPTGIAVDSNGDYFIAVKSEDVIDMVPKQSGTYYGINMTAGDIYTIAGTGTAGGVTSGVLATTTNLDEPVSVSVDSAGNVYIADYRNNDVEMIAATTCASSCLYGLSGTSIGYMYVIENGSSLAFCSSNGLNQSINPDSVFATDSNPPDVYFGDAWTERPSISMCKLLS